MNVRIAALAVTMSTSVAVADSVWINGAGLRTLSLQSQTGGQAVSQRSGALEMTLQNGNGSSQGNQMSQAVPGSAGSLAFTIAYSAERGYRFSVDNGAQVFTQVWGATGAGGGGAQSSHAANAGAHSSSSQSSGSRPGRTRGQTQAELNGVAPGDRSFNTLQLLARAEGADAAITFSDLTFDSHGALEARAGALLTAANVVEQASMIDGRTPDQGDRVRGQIWQTIVADVDLSRMDWTMSGRLVLSGGSQSNLTFELGQFHSDLQTIPLPPAVWSGLGSMVLVAAVRRARTRRRQAAE